MYFTWKAVFLTRLTQMYFGGHHKKTAEHTVTSFDVEVPEGSSGCELMTPNLRRGHRNRQHWQYYRAINNRIVIRTKDGDSQMSR